MKHVAISGSDGAGKSYLIAKVSANFTAILWCRHPQYLSGPFNLIMKYFGKNYRVSPTKEIIIGYHDYQNIVLALIYFILRSIDIYLYFSFKLLFVNLLNKRVLYDRFILDSIADMCVDIKRNNNLIFAFFMPLVLASRLRVKSIIIQRGSSVEKREDVLLDENAEYRESVYLNLINFFNCDIYLNEKWKSDDAFENTINS